jgi:competence protein ComEA
MSASEDWTTGPAKWAAVAVLGSASIFGMAWSAVTRAPVSATPAAASRLMTAPSPAEPAALSESAEESTAADPPSATLAPASRRIDLNKATAAELELLPGIGPALASRIIDHRRTSGPFRSVDELDEVKGIGPRTLEKLRPLVKVE